jgi:hypothetical protein
MKKTIAIGLVVVAAGLVSASSPLVVLNFNDADGAASLVNSGTAGGNWIKLAGGSLIPASSPNNPAGLAGRAYNYNAFRLSQETTYPTTQAQSFTIGGWLCLESEIPSGSWIYFFSNAKIGMGFGILLWPKGTYSLVVEPTKGPNPLGYAPINGQAKIELHQWVFVAITYDGTKTENNVTYYSATDKNSLTVGETVTLSQGAVKLGLQPQVGAQQHDQDSPAVELWVDNLRIYISETDATGVLSPSEIQEWMQSSDTDSKETAPAKPIILGEACPPDFVRTGTYRNI